MPTLILRTNCPLGAESRTALSARLSRFTAHATSKPEQWVMILIQDDQTMLFAGTSAPCAFVEFKNVGLADADMPDISSGLCKLLQEQIGIEPARTYIEFASAEPQHWGWNSGTF